MRAFRARNPHKIAAEASLRRARIAQRTPKWADLSQIESLYAKAKSLRESGIDVHVDHVAPLHGDFVSGLHVHYNLAVIPAWDNRSKSNRFEPPNG